MIGGCPKGDRIFVCVELTALDEQGNLAGASKAWRPATIVFHMPRVGDTEEQWCARVEGSNTPFLDLSRNPVEVVLKVARRLISLGLFYPRAISRVNWTRVDAGT